MCHLLEYFHAKYLYQIRRLRVGEQAVELSAEADEVKDEEIRREFIVSDDDVCILDVQGKTLVMVYS